MSAGFSGLVGVAVAASLLRCCCAACGVQRFTWKRRGSSVLLCHFICLVRGLGLKIFGCAFSQTAVKWPLSAEPLEIAHSTQVEMAR